MAERRTMARDVASAAEYGRSRGEYKDLPL